MALYRRTISSTFKLFLLPNPAVRSFSSLPKSSIVNSPYSSYSWLLHPYSQKLHSAEHAVIPLIPKLKAIQFDGYDDQDIPCVGSTRGWIRRWEFSTCQYFSYRSFTNNYLSHPFSNKSIELPVIDSSIQSATLSSSDPESDENCILMAVTGVKNTRLIYCRPGKDDEWRDGPLEKGVLYGYDQIVYSGNDQLFYTLSMDQFCIKGWKVDHESLELKNATNFCYKDVLGNSMHMFKKSERILRDQCETKHYLVVDEGSGDLLIVIKYTAQHVAEDGTILYEDPTFTFPYKTQTFDVFKVDFNAEKLQRLKSIGDRVLFLGNGNEPFCLHGSKHMGLQHDSIYFTDDFTENIISFEPDSFDSNSEIIEKLYFKDQLPYGGHDMGVYSLRNGTLIDTRSCSFFAGLQDQKKIEKPMFWVAPSTQLV